MTLLNRINKFIQASCGRAGQNNKKQRNLLKSKPLKRLRTTGKQAKKERKLRNKYRLAAKRLSLVKARLL